MSKIIYVYASAVKKCVHIRVSDAWLKKVKMALAIGCTLDGYCIEGARIKRKNQRNVSSVRDDSDDLFKGYDIFLNKHGVWEFKKYIPKPLYQRQLGKTLMWGARNGIQNLPRGGV